MKKMQFLCLAAMLTLLAACAGVQQRGMLGSTYISTARPAISIEAQSLALRLAGSGTAALPQSGQLGGLPVRVWLSVYGANNVKSPMAITALAEVPDGWYWDGIMRHPFSVNEGVEIFDNVAYEACTFIVEGKRDPFTPLVAQGEAAAATRWIARSFAARYSFNSSKVVLEYREPLPTEIVSLSSLPLGFGDFVKTFEQRAKTAFRVGPVPEGNITLRHGYLRGVELQYLDERFLGTVSKYDVLSGSRN